MKEQESDKAQHVRSYSHPKESLTPRGPRFSETIRVSSEAPARFVLLTPPGLLKPLSYYALSDSRLFILLEL